MSRRFFTEQPLTPGSSITLEPASSRHISAVLRMQPGEALTLFNGQGGEYPARLLNNNAKKTEVEITGFEDIERGSPLSIHLGIGVSRGERMDWVIQKSTELGVSAITPLFTERTEVKLQGERAEKKLRHWQQVAISACEQCGRNQVPGIHAPLGLNDWLEVEAEKKFVLHHRTDTRLKDLSTQEIKTIALLVGPEGGLSQTEITLAENNGFSALALGPRVLRTETAPLAAISVLQSIWGDLG